jgi:hypothetical protein
MWILHAKLLIKHFGNMYRYLCFVPNLIQIIINIVMLGCRPNIDLELHKTFFQKFLQSKTRNDSARTLIKACGNYNSIQIENHMKWSHLCYRRMKYYGSQHSKSMEFHSNWLQKPCVNLVTPHLLIEAFGSWNSMLVESHPKWLQQLCMNLAIPYLPLPQEMMHRYFFKNKQIVFVKGRK